MIRTILMLVLLAGCTSFPPPTEVTPGVPVVNISTLTIDGVRAFLIKDAAGRLVIVQKNFAPVYEDEQPGTFRMLLSAAGRGQR